MTLDAASKNDPHELPQLENAPNRYIALMHRCFGKAATNMAANAKRSQLHSNSSASKWIGGPRCGKVTEVPEQIA